MSGTEVPDQVEFAGSLVGELEKFGYHPRHEPITVILMLDALACAGLMLARATGDAEGVSVTSRAFMELAAGGVVREAKE